MKLTALLFSAALVGLCACNNAPPPADDGPDVTQDRNVPSASAKGLDISASLKLHVRIDEEPSCRLKGPARLLGHIKTEMDGTTFRISSDSKLHWSSSETAEAWVTIPHLQSLHTTGDGEIIIDTYIEEPSVNMNLSGSMNLDLAGIQSPELVLKLGGTGNVLVRTGNVDNARLSISGTGNIDAFELKALSADISVAGAGRAAITAVDRLDASISGTGMIRYKGNPEIGKRISGIGTLQNAN